MTSMLPTLSSKQSISTGLIISLLANFMEVWQFILRITLMFRKYLIYLMEKKKKRCGNNGQHFLSFSVMEIEAPNVSQINPRLHRIKHYTLLLSFKLDVTAGLIFGQRNRKSRSLQHLRSVPTGGMPFFFYFFPSSSLECRNVDWNWSSHVGL